MDVKLAVVKERLAKAAFTPELRLDDGRFQRYFCLSRVQFDDLLSRIGERITSWRVEMSPQQLVVSHLFRFFDGRSMEPFGFPMPMYNARPTAATQSAGYSQKRKRHGNGEQPDRKKRKL